MSTGTPSRGGQLHSSFRFYLQSRYELSKVDARAHIVDGLLAALENVDKVIDIVRKSSDQSSAKTKLQKVLGTSEAQTDAILRLQLGQLTRLNKGKLTEENADLEKSRQRVRRAFIRCTFALGFGVVRDLTEANVAIMFFFRLSRAFA